MMHLENEQALYDKSMELNVKGQLNDLDSATINSYANLHNGLWTLSNQRTQQKNLMTQSKKCPVDMKKEQMIYCQVMRRGLVGSIARLAE